MKEEKTWKYVKSRTGFVACAQGLVHIFWDRVLEAMYKTFKIVSQPIVLQGRLFKFSRCASGLR